MAAPCSARGPGEGRGPRRGPAAAPRRAGGRARAGKVGFTSGRLGRLKGQSFKAASPQVRFSFATLSSRLESSVEACRTNCVCVGRGGRGGSKKKKQKKKIKKKFLKSLPQLPVSNANRERDWFPPHPLARLLIFIQRTPSVYPVKEEEEKRRGVGG